jgi:SAM-dependent MidA family methyltransferase
MSSPLLALIVERIRSGGPITVAEYVEAALYHPTHGYYTSAAQRSGRAGDFFTSVDLGPIFGELLAVQLGELWRLLGSPGAFDIVEAAAGNGRLSRDMLDGAAANDPALLASVRLHLVERSPHARSAQPAVLGPHAGRLHTSTAALPERVTGVILANELLDAMPPHVVVKRGPHLRELFVDEIRGRLMTRECGPSSPDIAEYLQRVGANLEDGWVAEVNLAAARWVRTAASAVERGFLLLVDYGHEAAELYSAAHAAGTLMSFRAHASESRGEGRGWLGEPGERDLTSHVDLTGVRIAAEAAGLTSLGVVDQMHFLLGLGLEECLARPASDPAAELKRRLALKSLMLPGGLGSTHKVMAFGRGVGTPALRGMAFRRRLSI